ncbi:hypothetical protein A8E95_30175 [Burkholderia cenocepacia]|nr:hypothetical protein A8E96_19730 [Burkholderia cenocepacia]ONW27129.1 hypothetical protein A8E95_30175 [Burkholderia cenocepacia]
MNDRGAIDTRAGRRAPVTGCAGFLGSYVWERVVMEGSFVRDADFQERGHFDEPRLSMFDCLRHAIGRRAMTIGERPAVSRAVPSCADARRRASAARRTAGCIRG